MCPLVHFQPAFVDVPFAAAFEMALVRLFIFVK